MSKPFWKSKTVLLNAVAAVLAVFIDHENPVQIAQGLALLNIVLRFFTSSPVTASVR
jgi:alpha-D-ribose 1-methylphosphonate 5-triphosphate synthase subunit PhnH